MRTGLLDKLEFMVEISKLLIEISLFMDTNQLTNNKFQSLSFHPLEKKLP